MDASQWPQHQVGGLARRMEELQSPNSMNVGNMITSTHSRASQMVERKARPQKEQNLNCPRCNSTNTKFCYYNNYSLTQPRYFCKNCRRYWTQGGSLRNVPVGGGSRKNKRSSSSSPSILASSSASAISNGSTPTMMMTTKFIPDLNPPNTLPHLINSSQNPTKFLEAHDLNLAFPIQGIFHHSNSNENHEAINVNGFPNLQEFKPNVGVFPSSHGVDHGNSNNNNQNNMIGVNIEGGRLLFPFADMNKLASSAKTPNHPEIDDQSKADNDHHQQHHHQQHHHHHHNHNHQGPTGYWTGMLGGGAW